MILNTMEKYLNIKNKPILIMKILLFFMLVKIIWSFCANLKLDRDLTCQEIKLVPESEQHNIENIHVDVTIDASKGTYYGNAIGGDFI
jgi:hypothetical protein